ncbi:MAG: hypothetical protein AABX83_01725, partial [Nanoarchaeota archaeon]
MKNKKIKKRIAIILFSASLLLSIILFSLLVYSQQVTQVSSTPSIPNLKEIKHQGYKYANYSNI